MSGLQSSQRVEHSDFDHLNLFRISNFVLRISVLLYLTFPGSAPLSHAGIVFFDNVTTTHTPVFLKVLTKGVVLPEGGRLVEVYAGERRIGRILSGGDGYGFLKITPDTAGLKTYEARMDGESDSARLLAMAKDEGAILFEIEVLRYSLFSGSGMGSAQKALNKLSKKFRIIYLTRLIGVTVAEKIIAKEKFPASAVLDWEGASTLAGLKRRHIRMEAVIGSADTVSAAAGKAGRRFAFEKTADGTLVKDWDDILTQLQDKESE